MQLHQQTLRAGVWAGIGLVPLPVQQGEPGWGDHL